MTLFQEKINYLFKELDMKGREKEFVAWFSKKKHNYGARKKVVINTWLYGKMKKNPYWTFDEYPISQEKIDGVLVFEEYCFGEKESLKLFKERVDSYVLNKVHIPSKQEGFEYKYIYYFNLGVKKIFFLELNIVGKKSNGDYIIELIPSSFYTNKGIDKYIGTLIKNGNHYYISAKNRFEIVTFYFLTNRGFESNNIVYGLSLELSYANLLPTAKKRVMTTQKLTTEEKEKLYLSLNETEYLVSNEIFDNNEREKKKYFDNFYKKIENLNSFVKHSERMLREEIKDDASLNIFYDTFDFFYNKIQKISHPLDRFLLHQKEQDDDILNELEGTWYHYYYGSRRDNENRLMIWKSKLNIERSGEVKYIDGDRVVLKGVINTTFNKRHPFIYLTAIDSKSLALITFDENDIYRKIFKAPILDKQLSSSLNMASFGFFSKEKLDEVVVKKILGEENKILLEEDDIQSRINDYFNDKNFGRKDKLVF